MNPINTIKSEAEILTFDQKTARNIRMQKRYVELLQEGKQGHYETMFRVWHEEFELAKRMGK